ncbi:MAG TPA: DUF3168 domain-containing protein [Candidatus Angelobacter sp.]|nr:DUF3168 domain-containing protein [Candidatus Angelobacter sp.]
MLPDLVAFLNANTGVNTLIAGRLTPGILDEASPLPALTYTVLDEKREHAIDGTYTGFHPVQMEFECWAATYSDAVALSAAVIAAIDGVNNTTMGTTKIQGILVESESDRDREVYGTRRQYCHALDVLVMYGDS